MKKRPEKFTDILKTDYRWPKLGDRLIRSENNWDKSVTFSNSGISRHAHQWHGFMAAGAGLIELCTQDGFEHERHFAIYPILYCYRHGLELAMKWILLCYSGKGLKAFKPNHNLLQLWEKCRQLAEHYRVNDDEATIAVENIIKEFHKLDKKGVTFRYGWEKDEEEIPLPAEPVNLENIRDVMDGVAGYFDGLDGILSDTIHAH